MDRTLAVQCRDLSGVLFVDRYTGEVQWRGRFSWGAACYPGMDPWGDLRDSSWADELVQSEGLNLGWLESL